MKPQKIAIIGAGISGISVGKMLNEKGYSVTIFEKSNQAGGLVKCTNEQGVLFHRVGGHVFNSKNEKVLKWFWKNFNLEKEFIPAKRNAKIYFKDRLLKYPFENNIYLLEENLVDNIIHELIDLKNIDSNINNFHDFLKNNFGETLFNLYFKPYNNKIWKTDLREIPLPWLKGKLPMPNVKDIFLQNILRKEETNMVHSSFFYPKNGGSQHIVDTLLKDLEIVLNTDIVEYEKNNHKWVINNNEYDKIVFTGDVRKIPELLKLTGSFDDILKLKSNGTTTVLCNVDKSDLSWLYLPESKFESHRIIYTGNFSNNNNTLTYPHTCTIEFSGYYSHERITNEINKLPGAAKIIAYNYEPNSYIVHDFNTRKAIDYLKSIVEPKGFYLLGRFAEWEYYNMDAAMESAMNLVKKLVI